MKSPEDRKTPSTPPDFGVTRNDPDELLTTAQEREKADANGAPPPDLFDIDAVMAWFESLPRSEQSKRLMHLYISLHDEDRLINMRHANHVSEDRQEFAVINDELEYQGSCLELLMKHFDITMPPRPKERPRRRE